MVRVKRDFQIAPVSMFPCACCNAGAQHLMCRIGYLNAVAANLTSFEISNELCGELVITTITSFA
jgi:hypothetical protein